MNQDVLYLLRGFKKIMTQLGNALICTAIIMFPLTLFLFLKNGYYLWFYLLHFIVLCYIVGTPDSEKK